MTRSPERRRYHSRSRSKSRQRSSSDRSHSGEESNTLAIFNLYYRTDEDELRRIFERYGKIEKCNIVANRRSGQRTAFGFLTFESLADAREAKEDAHNMEIDGNIIRTDFCMSKGGHAGGGGHAGHNSYSRQRRQFYRSPSRERRRARYLRDNDSRRSESPPRSRSHYRSYESKSRRDSRSISRDRYRSPSPYRK